MLATKSYYVQKATPSSNPSSAFLNSAGNPGRPSAGRRIPRPCWTPSPNFRKDGFPIRWAVSGSGFWEDGGTTTSFGKWGKKFPDAMEFKAKLHQRDVKWMIGLRTNFVPSRWPLQTRHQRTRPEHGGRHLQGQPNFAASSRQRLLSQKPRRRTLEKTFRLFPHRPLLPD